MTFDPLTLINIYLDGAKGQATVGSSSGSRIQPCFLPIQHFVVSLI